MIGAVVGDLIVNDAAVEYPTVIAAVVGDIVEVDVVVGYFAVIDVEVGDFVAVDVVEDFAAVGVAENFVVIEVVVEDFAVVVAVVEDFVATAAVVEDFVVSGAVVDCFRPQQSHTRVEDSSKTCLLINFQQGCLRAKHNFLIYVAVDDVEERSEIWRILVHLTTNFQQDR